MTTRSRSRSISPTACGPTSSTTSSATPRPPERRSARPPRTSRVRRAAGRWPNWRPTRSSRRCRRSGAQVALVNRYDVKADLPAGPIGFEHLWNVHPGGLAVNVQTMSGGQLMALLATPNPAGWVLTPSAGLRYTLGGGKVLSMTLDGVPVSATQEIKVAGAWSLIAGFDGWPRWEGTTTYTSGPDDTGALAGYLVAHAPVSAPAGDRVTVRQSWARPCVLGGRPGRSVRRSPGGPCGFRTAVVVTSCGRGGGGAYVPASLR
ncbi:5'-nucleotidase C-terminal domain-containing protein [Nonomuraea sp. NPDC051191]|uniref:5'-nucleotidase C-terminal domain-containing protein n=1 Tax=Nonomuraea sp. NPDC051191 TaxID=3364372 RepID=UPI0037AF6BB1